MAAGDEEKTTWASRAKPATHRDLKRKIMALIAALFGMTLAFSSMLLSYYILTPKKRNQNHTL